MRIRSLTAFHVPVKLRKPIRHASHTRGENDTLIVRCELMSGETGWGEGLPRVYVTGESIDSVWRHLEASDFSVLFDAPMHGFQEAASALEQLSLANVAADDGRETRECFGNSVRCAIELAILDAIGKRNQRPLGAIVSELPAFRHLAQQVPAVYYSGVITAESPLRQLHSAIKLRVFGFRQVKVKVGVKGADDVSALRRIRRILGAKTDLRLDANEAWNAADVVQHMGPLQEFRPTCLEQPVPHHQVNQLADIRGQLTTPIMLDESLCCEADAQRAIRGNYCDLFNLRLSKCGGFLGCLHLAALAKANDLGYQLGCQVGETGILSAAGRHFACNVAQIRYLEGSYDRFLVRNSFTTEDLTFGYGGKGTQLPGWGLGITVDEAGIRSAAVRTHRLN